MSQSVYEIATNKIKDLLETNQNPWSRPWISRALGQQKNLMSGRPYSGINALILALSQKPNNYWLTFKAAQDLGLKIRKGEKSEIIIGWFLNESKSEQEETGQTEENANTGRLAARYFRVFNLSQIENAPQSLIDKTQGPAIGELYTHEEVETAEKLIDQQKANINFGSETAFYRPKTDEIHMPNKDRFKNLCEFYSTMFHEIGHWTGHETRLKRAEVGKTSLFNNKAYSQEELVAEMSSVFVCSFLNISSETSIRNSAAYLQSWLKFLTHNPKAFVIACQQGQKAADYIIGEK